MNVAADTLPQPPAEPWRRRFVRTLLYGRNNDRAAKARARVGLAILAFAGVYAVIAVRLVMFAVIPDARFAHRAVSGDAVATARPDILDRNGEVLATDVRVPSLFGEPRRLIDVDEAVELLTATLPDLDPKELRERLSSKRGFVWLKRDITPKQQQDIHRLGLPGIGFLSENKRVYPNGPEVSHLLGHVNIDNQGIAGIEKWLDGHGLADLHMAGLATDRLQTPVNLAVDLRVQHALRDELVAARTKFKALATAGIGARRAHRRSRRHGVGAGLRPEQSRPGQRSDPHQPPDHRRLRDGLDLQGADARDGARFRQGDAHSSFDARAPLQYGKFTIHDFHAQHRVLTVPEIFTYSSNIGAARMALAVGVEGHKAFLKKIGQLDRLRTELPESAEPIVPKRWGELNTITIAFGHGLSVAPLQAVMAVAALVNGGIMIPPTFLKRTEEEASALGKRVIKPETSEKMRYLMRLNVEKGSATRADVKGYYVGGKTGTAEKVVNGRYSKTKTAHRFHGGAAGRQAALSGPDHDRRAAGPAGDARIRHVGLECGADRRRSDRPDRAAARHRAAHRPADGRPADPGHGEGKQVRRGPHAPGPP